MPGTILQNGIGAMFAVNLLLHFYKIIDIFNFEGNRMAAKIKPVEPTVIKDKKIVREVIAQVRCKPSAEDKKWAKARRKLFNELTAK